MAGCGGAERDSQIVGRSMVELLEMGTQHRGNDAAGLLGGVSQDAILLALGPNKLKIKDDWDSQENKSKKKQLQRKGVNEAR